jgi:alpha-beta hydrolase superfamily lysophospholipase
VHNRHLSAVPSTESQRMCFRGHSPEIVCGHSMGGKVVLEYIKQTAGHHGAVRAPQHAWVLDSQPGEVPAGMVPDVERVLEAIEVCL